MEDNKLELSEVLRQVMQEVQEDSERRHIEDEKKRIAQLKEKAEREKQEILKYESMPIEKSSPIQSITPNCMQIDWKTPMAFICCPQEYGKYPLEDYANALRNGEVYAKSDNYESKVEWFVLSDDKDRLWVVSHIGLFAYGIAEITFKDGIFYHEYLARFETPAGCDYWITTELQGKKWDGPEWAIL